MTAAELGELEPLVRQAQAGDREAFGALIEALARPVYAVALAHLRNPTDAEDLVHDVFARAFVQIDRCRDPARFRAWLFAIARNLAKSELRRRRVRALFAHGQAALQPSVAPDRFFRRDLVRALASLRPRDREVLLLHDLEGYRCDEIAAVLGGSGPAARKALSRARQRLRAALEEPT